MISSRLRNLSDLVSEGIKGKPVANLKVEIA